MQSNTSCDSCIDASLGLYKPSVVYGALLTCFTSLGLYKLFGLNHRDKIAQLCTQNMQQRGSGRDCFLCRGSRALKAEDHWYTAWCLVIPDGCIRHCLHQPPPIQNRRITLGPSSESVNLCIPSLRAVMRDEVSLLWPANQCKQAS